jgi:c-di-GMP-related signal transduction protein
MNENLMKFSKAGKISSSNLNALEKIPQKQKWSTISDKDTIQFILEALGDDNKKNILTVANEPRIIPDILDVCSLPNTSGYRKIKELINDGMLVTCGFTTTNGGKKVDKYISIFDSIKINIIKNKIMIKVQFTEDYLRNFSFESSNTIQKIWLETHPYLETPLKTASK